MVGTAWAPDHDQAPKTDWKVPSRLEIAKMPSLMQRLIVRMQLWGTFYYTYKVSNQASTLVDRPHLNPPTIMKFPVWNTVLNAPTIVKSALCRGNDL